MSTSVAIAEKGWADELRDLLGTRCVTSAPAVIVARPVEKAQVVDVMRFANEHKLTVAVGSEKNSDVALDLSALNKIEHYDPGDLTIGIEAGATIATIESVLAAHGQMLPLDAPRSARMSIGGLLATGAQGPLSAGFGSVRDFCIGVEFVTGAGVAARAGGKVVKNVAGYDLMRLLIGSRGTLAVITSANFKVFPATRSAITFAAGFGAAEDAIAFSRAVRRSPLAPACLELLSPFAREYCTSAKDAETGSGAVGRKLSENWMVLVRAMASLKVLQRYRSELLGLFSGLEELAGASEQVLWRRVADMPRRFRERHPSGMLIDIHCVSSECAAVVAAVNAIAAAESFLFAMQGRVGLGNFACGLAPLATDPPEASHYAGMLQRLREAMPASASVIVSEAPAQVIRELDRWGVAQTDLDAMRTVKRALDPNGALGEGRFFV